MGAPPPPVEQHPPSSAGQHAPPPPLVSRQEKPSGHAPSTPGVQSITHSCSPPTAAQLPDWHSLPSTHSLPTPDGANGSTMHWSLKQVLPSGHG